MARIQILLALVAAAAAFAPSAAPRARSAACYSKKELSPTRIAFNEAKAAARGAGSKGGRPANTKAKQGYAKSTLISQAGGGPQGFSSNIKSGRAQVEEQEGDWRSRFTRKAAPRDAPKVGSGKGYGTSRLIAQAGGGPQGFVSKIPKEPRAVRDLTAKYKGRR